VLLEETDLRVGGFPLPQGDPFTAERDPFEVHLLEYLPILEENS